MSDTCKPTGEIVFSPQLFKASDMADDLAQKQLSSQELLELGKTATQAKARFALVYRYQQGHDSEES